jgi:hypothetical protein
MYVRERERSELNECMNTRSHTHYPTHHTTHTHTHTHSPGVASSVVLAPRALFLEHVELHRVAYTGRRRLHRDVCEAERQHDFAFRSPYESAGLENGCNDTDFPLGGGEREESEAHSTRLFRKFVSLHAKGDGVSVHKPRPGGLVWLAEPDIVNNSVWFVSVNRAYDLDDIQFIWWNTYMTLSCTYPTAYNCTYRHRPVAGLRLCTGVQRANVASRLFLRVGSLDFCVRLLVERKGHALGAPVFVGVGESPIAVSECECECVCVCVCVCERRRERIYVCMCVCVYVCVYNTLYYALHIPVPAILTQRRLHNLPLHHFLYVCVCVCVCMCVRMC